jgi:hypothetical protein
MAELDENDRHHWSGWPGACCLKCFSHDPLEIALASGDVYLEDVPENDEPQVRFKSEEIKQAIVRDSVCSVKGVLVWNKVFDRWDLIKPAAKDSNG